MTTNPASNSSSITTVAAFISRRRKPILLWGAALALAALAVSATTALVTAANLPSTVPSDAALYVYDTNVMVAEDGREWAWNDDANGSMSKTDPNAKILCPAGSTNTATFISFVGGERDPAMWAAWETLGYGTDNVTVLLPPLTPDRLGQGGGKAVRANGGKFSLGIACTSNNGITVTAAFFRTINVESGGKWKIEPLRD